MFTVQNFYNDENRISYDLVYNIGETTHIHKIDAKSDLSAMHFFIENSFTYLTITIDLLADKLKSIEHHYYDANSKPSCWSHTNWKVAYHDFKAMREALTDLMNRKEAYCNCVAYFFTRFEQLIPRFTELKRNEIKDLVNDIRSLPGRILKSINKYKNLSNEINRTTSEIRFTD